MKKPDATIFIAAVLVFLISLFFILDDRFLFKDPLARHRGDAIGYVAVNKGDVRFKEDRGLDWSPARKNQSLIYDDSIFVGAKSSAVIQVGESEIDVGENSLFVLRKISNANLFNLSFGRLTGEFNVGDRLVLEGRNGQRIEVNPQSKSKIMVQTNRAGETHVQVLSGGAQVLSNGKSETFLAGTSFFQNKALNVPDPTVKTARILSPQDGHIESREYVKDSISLEFELPENYPLVQYEIFGQEDLVNPLISQTSPEFQFPISIPDGSYVIRVRGVKDKENLSDWSKPSLFVVESRFSIDPNGLTPPLSQAPAYIPDAPKKSVAVAKSKIYKQKVSRSLAKATPEKTTETTKTIVAQNEPVTYELRTPSPLKEEKVHRSYTWDLNFGLGNNYVQFLQNGVEISSLSYSSVQGPSFSVSAEVNWEQGYGAEFSYSQVPGVIKSDTVRMRNEKFNWTTIGLEGKYRMPVDEGFWESSSLAVLFGAFKHRLPYVQTTDFDEAEIRNFEATMLAVGLEYAGHIGSRFKPEIQLRYSYPIAQKESNGDQLNLTTEFAFDGSIGSKYQLSPNLNMGLFWYGQYQRYKYRMINGINGDPDLGTSQMIFSNLEFRMGYSY